MKAHKKVRLEVITNYRRAVNDVKAFKDTLETLLRNQCPTAETMQEYSARLARLYDARDRAESIIKAQLPSSSFFTDWSLDDKIPAIILTGVAATKKAKEACAVAGFSIDD